MSKNNVVGFQGRESSADPLTELLRTGAQDLVCRAVEAELQELLAQYSDCRTAEGKAGVVRNGHLPPREIQTGLGPVAIAPLSPLPMMVGPTTKVVWTSYSRGFTEGSSFL